jgi:molecular chaperone DnaK (HSP70)
VCGGGANVPVLQKTITDMFSHCDILNSINPEEVIAVGAAKQVFQLFILYIRLSASCSLI